MVAVAVVVVSLLPGTPLVRGYLKEGDRKKVPELWCTVAAVESKPSCKGLLWRGACFQRQHKGIFGELVGEFRCAAQECAMQISPVTGHVAWRASLVDTHAGAIHVGSSSRFFGRWRTE